MDLSVDLGGLKLANPLVAASGVFGYGEEYCRVGDISWFGAVTVKGTTLHPRAGNPPPRIAETPSGMLNSIGLENPGAREVARSKIPWLHKFGVPIIVNISGDSYDEFAELAAIFADTDGVGALEANVSCPNVSAGGMAFGLDARSTYRVAAVIRSRWSGPLVVKLTPNAHNIAQIARAATEGGADVLSLINTLVGVAIDVKTRRPVLGSRTGGLSGPAVKPVALRCVYEVSEAVSTPIIGMGGVSSADCVLEFLLAGAWAVGIGSSLLTDPTLPGRILTDLGAYFQTHDISTPKELVGAAWRGKG